MLARFAGLLVILLLALPVSSFGQQDSTKSNPLQDMFETLNRAAQDTSAQKKATESAVGLIRKLGQINDSSAAARERVQNMQPQIGPDSMNALVEMMRERSSQALNTAESGLGHLYATPLQNLTIRPPRERVGPWTIAATGLPMPFDYAADVSNAGEVYLTGTYIRQVVLGDAYRNSIQGPSLTQPQELPRDASQGQARWVYELDTEGGMSGLSIEASEDGGAYVLARASEGPTTIAGRTFRNGPDSSLTALVRLDDEGRAAWAAPLARRSVRWNGNLASDGEGGVVAAYGLNRSLHFTAEANTGNDPASNDPSFTGEHDADQYLARFDADGTLRWRQVIDNVTIRSLTTSPQGTIYAAGHVNGPSPFCGGVQIGAEAQAAFAARLDAEGRCTWIQTSSASVLPDPEPGVARYVAGGGHAFHAITLAPDGDLYVTGAFLREMTFGTRTLRGIAPEGTGLVARLNPDTGAPRWTVVRDVAADDLITGARESKRGRAYGYDLAADDGGVYVVESRMQRPPAADAYTSLFWLVRVDENGRVEWEEPANVIAGLEDDMPTARRMKLVDAADGPPYLFLQGQSARLAGQTLDPDTGSVRYLFVSRLGGSDTGDHPLNRLRQLMQDGNN